MPDRSLRLPSLLLRERSSSPTPPRESEDAAGQPEQSGQPGQSGRGQGSAGGRGPGAGSSDDNPFAPPPEGAPDRPWQPRRPASGQDSDGGGHGPGGGGHSPWGSQWSDRQPGRSAGGHFGERPGGQGGPGGPGQGPEGGPGTGLRWDPTDPAQRRARYALLSGMWAFFFALFAWPYMALLLGSLAMYWAISSLRAKPAAPDPTRSAAPEPSGRPQKTAAISGLVTSSLALAMVAAVFTTQFVYRDYYTCVNDALTTASEKSCKELLPEGPVRELLGNAR
ncbi:hypothetical protein [Streptomyces capitiformicae]|uniref:Integral membrane protein n=1 Tax=Streptomyces capitiformicae TaxID=2014920 RepID=A0A919GKF3_9ACTN|nr:hypothetical protein [Streptomyces capitiformicae]GHH86284.1 hypothetical protein GCM10017771_22750 [Streptomyces capitiformicae]